MTMSSRHELRKHMLSRLRVSVAEIVASEQAEQLFEEQSFAIASLSSTAISLRHAALLVLILVWEAHAPIEGRLREIVLDDEWTIADREMALQTIIKLQLDHPSAERSDFLATILETKIVPEKLCELVRCHKLRILEQQQTSCWREMVIVNAKATIRNYVGIDRTAEILTDREALWQCITHGTHDEQLAAVHAAAFVIRDRTLVRQIYEQCSNRSDMSQSVIKLLQGLADLYTEYEKFE